METYARQTESGRVEIGVIVDSAYVPLATADDWRVAQLVENAKARGDVKKASRSKTNKADDGEAGKEGQS